ncbi:MAG: hypothetical protein Unbinned2990contig1002_5 [Prokaryotic dsDNA virus sp.]|nr:MAG: hypothetical protein Unbinned2990contig1002_5 [Prokaryotic dsDNA virus sp.]|tara:strand:- start:10967 stop:11158 length:192 start_codon:yes stop_codon:yes gene_type:complete
MKVKLKNGEKLTSNYSYCYLDRDKWTALNQGKEVDLDLIPNIIKDKVEEVGNVKASPKTKEVK